MRKYIRSGELALALYLDREAVRELVRNSWKDFQRGIEDVVSPKDINRIVGEYKDFLIDVVEEEFFRIRFCDLIIADVEDEEVLFFESPEEFVEYIVVVYQVELFRKLGRWDEE